MRRWLRARKCRIRPRTSGRALTPSTSCSGRPCVPTPPSNPSSPHSSRPPLNPRRDRKKAVELLLFCAAAAAASAETPALHWVPEGLSKAAAEAMEEMAAAGGWGGVGEILVAMMQEAVPPMKAVLKDTGVNSNDDMMLISAVRPPKEHAFVSTHQFRWLLSRVCCAPW